jgi:hypothetical protein
MKKLLGLIILFIIAASTLTLVNYFKNPKALLSEPVNSAPDSIDQGRVRGSEEGSLKIGMTKDIAGLSIRLNDLIEDFRCGADALCQEFGGVSINVTFNDGSSSTTRNMASDEVPIKFNGYNISIVRITPTKFADKEISKSEYEITFLVSPIALETINDNPGL